MEKEIITEDREDPIPGEYGHPIPLELFYRELGINGPVRHRIGRRILSPTLATKAVHAMCTKPEFNKRVRTHRVFVAWNRWWKYLTEYLISFQSFKLPTGARTTFHMAFSSDGARVASCHGDHNVYVCGVANGKIIQTLTGTFSSWFSDQINSIYLNEKLTVFIFLFERTSENSLVCCISSNSKRYLGQWLSCRTHSCLGFESTEELWFLLCTESSSWLRLLF